MAYESKYIRANERIRVPQVRLIGSGGEQVGIVPTKEALQRAQSEGLDLVEVAAAANPPVCRIMDLGKYIYSLNKKEKESRKKQKVIDVKEIKMSSKIEEHDYQTKLRNAQRFLERGDKIKFTMFFRGREIAHANLGQKIIDRFLNDLSEVGEVERNDGLEGKMIHIYLMPLSEAKKKAAVKKTTKEEEHAKTEDKESS